MSFVQNYGVHDPEEPELDDIDQYIDSQVVMWGELTPYGEELYENATLIRVYDEIQGRWIYV